MPSFWLRMHPKISYAQKLFIAAIFIICAFSLPFVSEAKHCREPVNLVQTTVHYPLATANDTDWEVQGRLRADLNRNGTEETVYILFKAQGHGDEGPWQVYIEDKDGNITHVFARYLNHQQVNVFTGATPDNTDGDWTQLFLLNSGTVSIGLYEIIYRGPNDYSVYELSNVLPLYWATSH